MQVAQLAGIPQPVIRSARKHLADLEAHSLQSTPQFDLFSGASSAPEAVAEPAISEEEQQALDALKKVDPDSLSPREALDALYELKQLLGK